MLITYYKVFIRFQRLCFTNKTQKQNGSFSTKTSGSFLSIVISPKVNEIQISIFGYLIFAVKKPKYVKWH